ncbi:MAG: multicopper oxidase domain-containing protein [Gemmatimonadota bacterium]|nr:multicopper oxidase domain-containing protein [Gemmatimonadota bacterium]
MNTQSAVLIFGVVASLGAALPHPQPQGSKGLAPERVIANDNRRPAGTLHDSRLELALEIRNGLWFPEAEDGPSAVMPAFAEVGHAPEVPGPLIRVAEGTAIHITLRNTRADSQIVVHGLHTRPSASDDVVRIPAGGAREVTFLAGAPGTYFYWASVGDQTLGERQGRDGALSGAIIVDLVAVS